MKKLILASGVRLSNKGLHLGHYLGCFTPLSNFTEDYDFYFIINDVSNLELNTKDKEDTLINMVEDILSIETPKNIRIFLQSDILKHQSDFYSKIQKITSFNQLIAANPHNKIIKTGKSQLSVLDYLFPIRDTVVYLSLETDIVLMNDDNSRIIDFSRRVSQKINNLMNMGNNHPKLKQPYLKTGFIPRLLGFDYRKMCNRNNNAIYLTESPEILKNKINKTVNTKYLNYYLKEKFNDSIPENLDLNAYFVPKLIAEIFGESNLFFEFEKNNVGEYVLKDDSSYVKNQVCKIVEQSLFKFRTKKEVFENKKDIIRAKLRDDYLYLEMVMDNFKSTYIS